MEITHATGSDLHSISEHDKHITKEELLKSILFNRVLVIKEHGQLRGWLRYNLFWDNTPFLTMLFILTPFQGKGLGTKLVTAWEKEMKEKGYPLLMTSTLSNEQAQHFYRKLNYTDAGSLLLKNEPLEIFFTKDIQTTNDS